MSLKAGSLVLGNICFSVIPSSEEASLEENPVSPQLISKYFLTDLDLRAQSVEHRNLHRLFQYEYIAQNPISWS